MRLTRLGEICNVSSAGDKPTDFTEIKTAEHTIPVVANGIENDGIIGYTSEPKISRNAVTISARGNIGTAFYRNYPYYPVIRLISVYPKNDSEIDCQYLYYLLKNSPLKSIGSSVQAQLTVPIASDVDLFIEEDYKNQRLIAAFLGTIDNKISTNNKIIEISEKLMREIYDYWFVQFDFPDENGRPYKSSGGEMVYDEKLKREIPKGWKTVELGDVIKEAKKSSVQVNEARERIGAFPFFTSGDEILDFDEYYVDGFNIFLNTGGNADIKSYYGKSAYSTDTWCISADDYPYILFIFLDSIKGQIDNNCFAGSGLKHLQKNAFKKIKLVVPEENLLTKFNELAQSSYQAISSYKSENKRLASLRDWLLPMLMNGQIKVSG